MHLWENLKTVAESYNILWLVAGDFNDHGGSSEKISFGSSSSQNRSSVFINNINGYGLADLRCGEPGLTWSNNRQGLANTLVRLDRALANANWCLKFLEASVTNLPRTYSNHCPMVVRAEGTLPISHAPKPF